jgi:hypothetical protein
MAQYYKDQPSAPVVNKTENPPASAEPRVLSESDKLRRTLLTDNAEEGWASKLCCYLNTMKQCVTKETDLVEWWQVRIDLHSVEPCSVIPDAQAYRAQCSPCASVICSM